MARGSAARASKTTRPAKAPKQRRLAIAPAPPDVTTEEAPHADALRRIRGLERRIDEAITARDFALAGRLAMRTGEIRRASRWWPVPRLDDPRIPPPPRNASSLSLTPQKLVHDIAQFRLLQDRGYLGHEFDSVIDLYETMLERLAPLGENARVPLTGAIRAEIGHVFGRIVHVRRTPRVEPVFSGRWEGRAIEEEYLGRQPNAVVVDDFLSEEAVRSLYEFGLESTVWLTNRYDHGRFGAFFRDGFDCPLLVQIAEQLSIALPRIIGTRHPLRQIWGFKYANKQPCLGSHADFAAINVNFWITPDHANLDPEGGGLHLYDIPAPREWDFDMYNRGGNRIRALLESVQAKPTVIPYRHNRAVIFDSDLFHATAGVNFSDGYVNQRMNVTFLYGDRLNDQVP
jgi:hypothetical protein